MKSFEFVALTERRISIENTEAFQFRSDRSAVWLQKICLFILRKLRAFSVETLVDIERHTIDARTFMEKIQKQQAELKCTFNKRPTILLIGAEDYAELMHEATATRMFSFPAKYGVAREILGMTVYVIPWMRGCLVMPDLN